MAARGPLGLATDGRRAGVASATMAADTKGGDGGSRAGETGNCRMLKQQLWATAVFAATVLMAVASPGGATKPNIIVILADDLGPGDVGAYGGTLVPTPRLERAGGRRDAVHAVLLGVADLLTVARRPDHRTVPGALAHHQLPADAEGKRRRRDGRFPRPPRALAAAGLEGGRVRHGAYRQVAPRRRPRRDVAAEVRRVRVRRRRRHLREPRAASRHHLHQLDLGRPGCRQALGPVGLLRRSHARLPGPAQGHARLRQPVAR